MEQQSTGEEKRKISRSKARHLRRKRLAAARRTTEINSFPSQSNTEENSSVQEPTGTLSKSKARRLRKKKKAEKRISDSDSQTELVFSSQSPTNISEYEKSDRSLCELQFDAIESSDCIILPTSLIEAQASPVNTDKSRDNDTPSTFQQHPSLGPGSSSNNLGKVQRDRDSLSSDDLQVLESGLAKSLSKRDYQIQKNLDSKVLPQGTSTDVNTKPDPKFNQNREGSSSLFKTVLVDNQDNEPIGSSRIPHIRSNQLIKNNEVTKANYDVESRRKKEIDNETEGLDLRSSNPLRNTTSCSFQTDPISDDDLGSPSSNSSSNLIDQYELNTTEAHDSLGLITRTGKTVLNTTELIENEKNLKISGSSSSSHTVFQPNSTVIDLSTYSSSDFIINRDSASRTLEEQQIIIDFISDSSSDLIQNNQLFYTNLPETSSAESQNINKIHEGLGIGNLSISQNQTSFDIIKDYSLPSTSVNDPVPPVFKDSKPSVEHKTLKDSDSGRVTNEFEGKMSAVEKTREQIKAEREAKKAAKALAKSKGKAPKSEEKTAAQSSKDTSSKSSSEPVQVDIRQITIAKKVIFIHDKTLTKETKTAPSVDNKDNEAQSTVDGKSKRENRAERRAKQEAQRAAKEKLAAEKNKPKSAAPPKSKPSPKVADPAKMVVRKTLVDNNLHEVKLFKHLYHARELSLVNSPILNANIHPAIVRLGVQYANKVIIGSNARCVALLAAVKQLVEDFERPSQADFTRGLEASLQECAAYLHHCRPMAVSMQNALRHLKWQMSQLPATVSDNDAKSKLGDAIDTYIREQILLAGKAISNTIQTKISNGDVILTYAFSSLIHNILIDAHVAGKQFRVIVVDGRPWLEGKEQLRRLAKHGIECSYILINALSFIMPEVSKVFLGAHAILANGAVMSRAGTAQVALMAKAFNVPVLVACETHKSCERVQTDSFVYNEIGDADELARDLFSNSKKPLLANWKTKKSLDLLNITFDVTPADLVSAVVTELAILPCTSIPVILRIKPSEI